ncbi:uncharacterized protein TNCV_350551 [Trichonephila clavipes]|nr:uncharacterized protein TNCV_350551 [Trichonephila clavipes]
MHAKSAETPSQRCGVVVRRGGASSATRGLLVTDHVILNHGQVTWTSPELAPLLLTTAPHQREDVSALERFRVHRCPTRRIFSGTGLELVTKPATIRYLYHSATAATCYGSWCGQIKCFKNFKNISRFQVIVSKRKEKRKLKRKITPRTDNILIRNRKMNQSKTSTDLRRDFLDYGAKVSISTVQKMVLEVSRKASRLRQQQFLTQNTMKKRLS